MNRKTSVSDVRANSRPPAVRTGQGPVCPDRRGCPSSVTCDFLQTLLLRRNHRQKGLTQRREGAKKTTSLCAFAPLRDASTPLSELRTHLFYKAKRSQRSSHTDAQSKCDAIARHRATILRNLSEIRGLAHAENACSGYFAAAAAVLFASARRSVFLRRTARFFTLSLPLQCPIGAQRTRSAHGCQAVSQRPPTKSSNRGGLSENCACAF